MSQRPTRLRPPSFWLLPIIGLSLAVLGVVVPLFQH